MKGFRVFGYTLRPGIARHARALAALRWPPYQCSARGSAFPSAAASNHATRARVSAIRRSRAARDSYSSPTPSPSSCFRTHLGHAAGLFAVRIGPAPLAHDGRKRFERAQEGVQVEPARARRRFRLSRLPPGPHRPHGGTGRYRARHRSTASRRSARGDSCTGRSPIAQCSRDHRTGSAGTIAASPISPVLSSCGTRLHSPPTRW